MRLLWEESAWEDYLDWQSQDKRTLKRINQLIRDIQLGIFVAETPLRLGKQMHKRDLSALQDRIFPVVVFRKPDAEIGALEQVDPVDKKRVQLLCLLLFCVRVGKVGAGRRDLLLQLFQIALDTVDNILDRIVYTHR